MKHPRLLRLELDAGEFGPGCECFRAAQESGNFRDGFQPFAVKLDKRIEVAPQHIGRLELDLNSFVLRQLQFERTAEIATSFAAFGTKVTTNPNCSPAGNCACMMSIVFPAR